MQVILMRLAIDLLVTVHNNRCKAIRLVFADRNSQLVVFVYPNFFPIRMVMFIKCGAADNTIQV